MKRLITTECVSVGHPDKTADFISDSVLDAYLNVDKNSKVAVETMVKDNIVVLGGEVTSTGNINVEEVIKNAVEKVGFTKEQGFHHSQIKVINLIGKQSPQINNAVVKTDGEVGAGDQGFMTGFASCDTLTFMPLGMYLARALANYVNGIKGLGPDIKTQVTVEEDGISKRIHTILVSTMTDESWTLQSLQEYLTKNITQGALGLDIADDVFSLIDENTKIVINPAGEWTIGGPVADCGMTGRKIVVDQYGPYSPVGGGSISSKDFSKIDRSGAYLCRYISKNIVSAGLSHSCKTEIAYMIGVAEPVSINIELYDIFGDRTNSNLVEELTSFVKENFPMTPNQIATKFDLRKPFYSQTVQTGAFGNNFYEWEKLDMVEKLKEKFKK